MPFNTPQEGHLDVGERESQNDSLTISSEASAQSSNDAARIDMLAKQIGQIASRLDALTDEERGSTAESLILPIEEAARHRTFSATKCSNNARPTLPDAKRVRMLIRDRQRRTCYFKSGLFSDPAWDMLLDLTAAEMEQTKVSVTSLCIASGVPDTTALRWINVMIDEGLVKRVDDKTDKRRVFIELTANAKGAVAEYFADLTTA